MVNFCYNFDIYNNLEVLIIFTKDNMIVSYIIFVICSCFGCSTIVHELGHFLSLKFFLPGKKVYLTFNFTYTSKQNYSLLTDRQLKLSLIAGPVFNFICPICLQTLLFLYTSDPLLLLCCTFDALFIICGICASTRKTQDLYYLRHIDDFRKNNSTSQPPEYSKRNRIIFYLFPHLTLILICILGMFYPVILTLTPE